MRIRTRNQLLVITSAIYLVAIAGACDAGVRGTQRIELMVLDAGNCAPAVGVGVRCAQETPRRSGPSTRKKLSAEGYVTHYGTELVQVDESGKAAVVVEIADLGGGLFVWLGLERVRLRDHVTGNDYSFVLEGEQNETFRVNMVPGALIRGDAYMLGVLAIGAPVER